jgi:hypothetical protein
MEAICVFEVEDADAVAWRSEIAVVASKAGGAGRLIRAAGLHKRQILNDGRPVRVLSLAELPAARRVASCAGGMMTAGPPWSVSP